MEENIEEFIKGNKKAFDGVYEKYSPSMFGICMRYANCRDDAQEILQETFIKVYLNREKMNPQLPIGPWIKTITIRTAINFLKTQKRMILTENEDFFEAPHEWFLPEKDPKDQKNLLLKLMSEMPPGYRTVFNLFVLDNLTHKEIAEYLDISEGASKSQLAKAKNWIKINLEKKRTNERA
ncbi:RNA polymerase sigma factor [Fluviicola taffensis]|uniref:RNA polymerase sigma factor n=1 Tax=Fluviicola taffensis (strain DSM 16823 / NCIMB 13979 / RW262) TaxID=755732 RepID=F2IDR3_FLUTR|nr:sigma-70 family RNA polymerase sigma factor [Fluviicola taffensis]AEA44455.1 RNA polymerase, sigma-24 subunit, ECF subfamily [Fluviicola taffensis DSM 16823]